MDEDISGDITSGECQIGKGLKPLAQHGRVVVGKDGTISLYGTKGDLIDSSPLSEVTAKLVLVTGGQTVSLRMGDRKYNVAPGWGAAIPGFFNGVKAPRALVTLVKNNGQH
jgi:hypothetical protein